MMDIEILRQICLALPGTSEDIKWDNDLCFLVGKKMFCVTSLSGDFKASLKCDPIKFQELLLKPGVIPAPYLARAGWISLDSNTSFSKKEWQDLIETSYRLIFDKLTSKEKTKINS